MREWAAHLAAVVLLAGVAEMLLPEGSFRAYGRVALGLMVAVAVLQPVLQLLSPGADWWRLPAPEAQAVAEEGRLTRDVYRRALEEQIARIAAAVPGVARARAEVVLGEGLPPTVAAVQVVVSSRAVSPVRVGGERRSPLAEHVAAAVAAALGLPADRISVRVGEWPS